MTAIMHAVGWCREDMVEMLLEHGANPLERNNVSLSGLDTLPFDCWVYVWCG